MEVQLLYFAWVREKAGLGEEKLVLPPDLQTVQDLILWQQGRGDNFSVAFANSKTIRVALDQQHATPDSPLAGAKEIAFFPPVTGG